MLEIIVRNTKGELAPATTTQFHFPAGEAHLKVTEEETPVAVRIVGCDPDDLIMLGMVADWATQEGEGLTIYMPYLPGARADRGKPFGAKVYADIINSFNAKEIVCFDPHSPVMPGLINNLRIVDSAKIITDTVLKNPGGWAGIISPDEGSRERSGRIAEAAGLPLIQAYKHRDFDTGKLHDFSCDPLPDPDGRYLLVDDICDGGGTFMGTAQATGLDPKQLSLWVSHGVFSGNAPANLTHYGEVWTTNSHPGALNPEVNATVVDVFPYLEVT
jgi:ribose-phosphate pyrophosphokinase